MDWLVKTEEVKLTLFLFSFEYFEFPTTAKPLAILVVLEFIRIIHWSRRDDLFILVTLELNLYGNTLGVYFYF